MPSKRMPYYCLLLFSLVPVFTRVAISRAQPMDTLALNDLSGFQAQEGAWDIAGDAWALWDSIDLEVAPGTGIVVRRAGHQDEGRLVTGWEHGDLTLELEYMLSQGASAGIYLQGRYEVGLTDSWGVKYPRASDATGIGARYGDTQSPGHESFEGHAPRANASRAPGLWQRLRIVFEAPRFDATGRKMADARIVRVVHNGVIVQESVRVGGPTRGAHFYDERPAGPLVIEGGAGAIALRNLRYRHYEPIEPVTLADVRYTLYRGEFDSLAEMRALPPEATGEASGYVWNLFGRTADRIGLDWAGRIRIPRTGEYTFAMRFNWIDEIPYEEDAVAGRGRFTIDDAVVVDHAGDDSTAFGTVQLHEGTYPFTISYFKNRQLWRPIVFLRVEGPGMPVQYLNAYRTLPEPETSYPMVPVDPGREPYVLRSFADYGTTKKTNVVSVGDPSGVHYALDLNAGSLLSVWKGAYVDVGSMWTGRGELQNAVPLGQRIDLSDKPTVGLLPNEDAPWPDAVDSRLAFKGYTLDADGLPTFRYAFEEVELREALRPERGGRALRRSLAFSSTSRPENLWVRAAEGRAIRERAPGIYSVDGAFFVELSREHAVRLRHANGLEELLVSVPSTSEEILLDYSIIW
jgi:hypothetical protein